MCIVLSYTMLLVQYYQYNTDLHGFLKLTKGITGDNCIKKFHLGRYIVGYTV